MEFFEVDATVLFRVTGVSSAEAAVELVRTLALHADGGLPETVKIGRVIHVSQVGWSPLPAAELVHEQASVNLIRRIGDGVQHAIEEHEERMHIRQSADR